MSFRTIVISKSSKISYKNRFLVVKQELEEKYIHLSEIDTVIIDSISVSISAYLLKELSDSKINVIFCDEKHNPYGELLPLSRRCNTSKKIIEQTKWTIKQKDTIWMNIVKNKILNQTILLQKINSSNFKVLSNYVKEVKIGDKTNREGHAAKIYFKDLFGKEFIRHNDDNINSALNYGYTILLSTINKEIVNNGCLTQLGIHHKNEFNEFNLTCDLIEPFRVIIDKFVYNNLDKKFDIDYKLDLVNLFNQRFRYNKKMYILKDIIEMYVKNTLDCLFDINNEYMGFIYEE